ncbi:MAG: hypothetical protein K0S97_829 [Chloroflexota bacterium]|nr:hypothetical protein [Chloroflexota bacterium]
MPSSKADSSSLRHTTRVSVRIALLALLALLLIVAAACRQRVDDGSAAPSGMPEGSASPVAPAIQTDHPDAEQTIPFPSSSAPVAPAVQGEHPDAEETIPWPSSPAPVAPAVQGEHPDAEQTLPPPSHSD